MRTLTPGLALGWQLWVRNRWGARAGLATLVVLAAAGRLVFPQVRPEYALFVTTVTLFLVFGFVMNAVLFVERTGNMASGYPSRMYPLPVSAWTLVFWPLLYGATIVALLCPVAAGLIDWLLGFRLPVLLPTLGLVAMMTWLQVLSWLPLRPAWLRLAAVALVIGGVGGITLSLVVSGVVGREWIEAFLAISVVAAFPMALVAVASDRRGVAWRVWPDWSRLSFGSVRGGRRPFPSAARAQLWYEWRCHGLVFPAAVAAVTLPMLGVGAFRHARADQLFLLAFTLLPVFLATGVGTTVSRLVPFWVKHPGGVAFLAIRPVATRSLVAAKFRMTLLSVMLSWVVALVLGALALAYDNGTTSDISGLWNALIDQFPGWRAPLVLALGLMVGPALAFRQLTDYFPLALTGRPWIETAAAFVMTSCVVGACLTGLWLQAHPAELQRFLAALPWLMAILVAIKVVVAAWSFKAAVRRGLLARSDLFLFGTTWLVVLALIAAALQVLIRPAHLLPVTRIALLLGIVVVVPISRFALAPLALDWNRHR